MDQFRVVRGLFFAIFVGTYLLLQILPLIGLMNKISPRSKIKSNLMSYFWPCPWPYSKAEKKWKNILRKLQTKKQLGKNGHFSVWFIKNYPDVLSQLGTKTKGRSVWRDFEKTYRISANSFLPWIVSAPVCTVVKGHST